MTKEKAKQVLSAMASKDYDTLRSLTLGVFGNKGRLWTNTACLMTLDSVKGECNPRLSHNYCDVEQIGCPKCMETLELIAEG
jgi:hypothetical protein